jgi:hypothetical protein
MTCQSILKFGSHEGQSGYFSFIFNTINDLDNGQLNKLRGLKKTKQQQIVNGKLMSQFSDYIIISWFFHNLA